MPPRLVLLGLLASSALAYAWPDRFGSGFDPFLASKPYLWPLIAAAMFVIGWLLPRDEVRQVAHRWPAVLGGTALQYAAMPLLAFGFGLLLAPDRDALVGILLVGCVPGAMASNVLTLLARGHVSYSVGLTTAATLLSPLVVPLAMRLTLGQVEVAFPVGRTVAELVGYVVLPVVTGHLLSRRLASWRRLVCRVGPVVANLAILWIIAVVVAANRGRLAHPQPAVLMALLGVNLLGYLAGDLGSRALRLPPPMRRALTLEVGMQNAGLGTTLALGLFPDRPAVAIPGALYTFGCMLTGTVLASYWGGRVAATEGAVQSPSVPPSVAETPGTGLANRPR
ncbi:bile acid:sodium symporter family protein [Tautonia plasticadhaerens]|nr:bile acid:sodium symporter family protein [Tautonia plasticadhaerens]